MPACCRSGRDVYKRQVEYPEPVEDDRDFRDLTLAIGESTGAASVTNKGSITITQNEGTFTAREVASGYENITITVPDLSLIHISTTPATPGPTLSGA